MVPFAVEDGGLLGAHAHTFLRTLAERTVRQGRKSRPTSLDPGGNVARGAMELLKCPCGFRV